jgi:hypothetical protein
MLDQAVDGDDISDPSPDQLHGTYPPQFDPQQQPQQPPTSNDFYQPPPTSGQPQMLPQTSNPPGSADGQFGNMGELIDPNDPMLDADPFGLSASMHYPTSYAFEQPPHQR